MSARAIFLQKFFEFHALLINFIDETFTKEQQKDLDLKTILELLPNGEHKNLLMGVVKEVADKQKTIRNETISYDEAAPSFLEETHVETVSNITAGQKI